MKKSRVTTLNEFGAHHTLTGHVNVNDGTGYVNAAAGTTINFSIVSEIGRASCRERVKISAVAVSLEKKNSATRGVTAEKASTSMVMNGGILNRAIGTGKE